MTTRTRKSAVTMKRHPYMHGYSAQEYRRLFNQATALAGFLHLDTVYPAGTHVLEAGCGVGAQSVLLAHYNFGARFTSIDISADSLKAAQRNARRHASRNLRFVQADVHNLPFPDQSFDHLFVCFLLEHLPDPSVALQDLFRVLKPGGTITAIEGDHGSCYFHPETAAARAAWQAVSTVQRRLGGNPAIGRTLYPLLNQAGFTGITISPRQMYADSRSSMRMQQFVRDTIIAMAKGIGRAAIARTIITADRFAAGIADLEAIPNAPDGVFCYTFFKAVARRPS